MADTVPALSERDMAERTATGQKVANNLRREFVDYDTAEGYFLDHVCNGATEAQTDELMRVLDDAYDR